DNHHLYITHAPLIMLPAGFFAGTLFVDTWYGVAVVLSLMAHYIHDSCGTFGIRWLWPLSDVFCKIGRDMVTGHKGAFHFFSLKEIRKFEEWHVRNLETWLKKFYFACTLPFLVELSMSAALLGTVAADIGMQKAGLSSPNVFWVLIVVSMLFFFVSFFYAAMYMWGVAKVVYRGIPQEVSSFD
ncbi:MAG: hypothetical protein G01um101470_297, partial [Parcubacteria group bacterium Gr01-1014_70]